MKPPQRAALQALIALPCMIQRDRAGRAFFISDYPRRLGAGEAHAASARLREAGFELRPAADLMLIDWAADQYVQLYAALPLLPLPPYPHSDRRLWSICRLLYQHPHPLEAQDQALLRQALRWLLVDDRERLLRLLTQGLAEALRCHRAPPHHAARLLISRGITT